MTGYTVHTGASKKFVTGWDRVFADSNSSRGKKKSASKAAPRKAAARKK